MRKTSVALYAVSSDVDGARIVKQISIRINKALVEMLASAREPISKDLSIVASMLQSAMAGVSRKLLESPAPEKELGTQAQELTLLVRSYLKACAAQTPAQ